MKKLTILTSLALMSISGSAMAVAPTPFDVLIDGFPAGAAQFVFVSAGGSIPLVAPSGTCDYQLLLTPTNPLIGPVVCEVLEARTVAFPSCVSNRTQNIDSIVAGGDGFSDCNVVDQFGFPAGPDFGDASATLVVGESATGILSGILVIPTDPMNTHSIAFQ
ncbi:hypothetical protein [Sorangium sp. So ce513]|uniref:hypothetical protein n=1 Tax=Sorangium sp. So ce513 TaxID=3133315 RepID=UPI003F6162DD